jgi:DNA-binding response OmpR family regulator
MMPKKDGFTLSAEIRMVNRDVPLVLLTARGMKEDMMRGYRAGVDDYIVKPFDSELLLLKIEAILSRRHKEASLTGVVHKVGALTFNSSLRILNGNGLEVKLSPKEAALLTLLCRYKNDVLPRAKALKEIWKEDNYFTGRSMDVYIAKLRKHIGADPDLQIESLHGNGYSLREGKQSTFV